jgi:hypothetical protein
MTVKPAALALLLALACKPSPPTVDAETTAAASPAPEPEPPTPVPAAGASCFHVGPDGSLYRVPCSPTLPRTPPTGSTPVAGICCVPPDGPCLAVELASECPDTQDFLPCDWGYETVDANGMPTVVCFD